MSLVTLGGGGGKLFLPIEADFATAATGFTCNAAGESAFAIGRVRLTSGPGTSKVISAAGAGQISFATGAITFANAGTTLRIGINDVGATGLEDGTHDVFADFVGGTDTIAANSVVTATMESGTKTIADGDLIAVGVEMTARAGADSVQLVGWVGSHTLPYSTVDVGAGPVKGIVSVPQLTIKFDDGTYGWVGADTFAYQVTSATLFGSSSTPDEHALLFQVPFDCTLRGIKLKLQALAATDDFEVILYTTPLGTPTIPSGGTITVDADLIGPGNAVWFDAPFASAHTLAADTDYAIAIRPTTANTLTYWYLDFVVAALRTPSWFGTTWRQGTRTDQTGAFSETHTIVPAFGLYLSALDNGAGEGSGGSPGGSPVEGMQLSTAYVG